MWKEVLKRGSFLIIGLMIMFAGLIIFNIPIQDDVGEESEIEDDEEAGSQGAVDAILFFGGVSLCFGVGPYFLLAALFGRFLHESSEEEKVKKLQKIENRNQPLIDHYWEALGDENHPHHNFVKRAKWKDKIKWKHRPLETFVHFRGKIVPKKSEAYKKHRRSEREYLRKTYTRKEWDFERDEYVEVYDGPPLGIDINLLDRRIWGGFLLLQLPLAIGGIIIGMIQIINGNITSSEILTNVIFSLIILLILTLTFTDLLSRKK